jgi:hypothetical protein
MWSWTEGQGQGVKMCFEDDIFEGSEQEGQGQMPIEAEYRCLPSVFSESKFDIPTDVNFMDMSQLPGAYGE